MVCSVNYKNNLEGRRGEIMVSFVNYKNNLEGGRGEIILLYDSILSFRLFNFIKLK